MSLHARIVDARLQTRRQTPQYHRTTQRPRKRIAVPCHSSSGTLDDSLTFPKLENAHIYVIFVAKSIHNRKVFRDIIKRSTIPICVCIAILSGVAPTNIGFTLRSDIPTSTPTAY